MSDLSDIGLLEGDYCRVDVVREDGSVYWDSMRPDVQPDEKDGSLSKRYPKVLAMNIERTW